MHKIFLTLKAFKKASPNDLGPVAFVQWARGLASKSDLHTKYHAIALDAAASPDPDTQAMGRHMQELWEKEQAALLNYWKEVEPLRKLRSRNIMSAARDSSTLQRAVGRHQLRKALMELQQEEKQEDPQPGHQRNKANDVFCATGDAKDDIHHLVDVDVPELPCEETDLVVRIARDAGSMKYLEFRSTLKNSSLELTGLAGDVLKSYTATNALWQSPTQLVRNENTYIKQSVMPMIDAVFGSLDLLQHWQRDPRPVLNGHEEEQQPDFFAEVDGLSFAVMEVKKLTMTKEEAEADTRRLPCMMKIALDTLVHGNVKGATVIGFLVKENVCEVLTMTLEHEDRYIPKSLGCCKLPQDRLDIAPLLLALGPLTAAKTIAFKMVKAIKKRSRLTSTYTSSARLLSKIK